MRTRQTNVVLQNRVFIWIAVVTGLILLVPLIAMQFTSEVDWTPADFVVAGALLFVTMSLLLLAARRANTYRVLIGVTIAAVFLYVWAELAVGVFTDLGS